MQLPNHIARNPERLHGGIEDEFFKVPRLDAMQGSRQFTAWIVMVEELVIIGEIH